MKKGWPKGKKRGPNSPESNTKRSLTQKGRPLSEEHKRTIGDRNRGQKRNPLTDEHRSKIGDSNRGKPKSLEHRANMSKARKGVPRRGKPRPHTQGSKSHRWGKPPAPARRIQYGDVTFRSTYEHRFAIALDARCIEWEYEKHTFTKN